MTSKQTAVEIGEECVSKMSADLGQIYFAIDDECSWLHFRWQEQLALYEPNPGGIELLNRAAPSSSSCQVQGGQATPTTSPSR